MLPSTNTNTATLFLIHFCQSATRLTSFPKASDYPKMYPFPKLCLLIQNIFRGILLHPLCTSYLSKNIEEQLRKGWDVDVLSWLTDRIGSSGLFGWNLLLTLGIGRTSPSSYSEHSLLSLSLSASSIAISEEPWTVSKQQHAFHISLNHNVKDSRWMCKGSQRKISSWNKPKKNPPILYRITSSKNKAELLCLPWH